MEEMSRLQWKEISVFSLPSRLLLAPPLAESRLAGESEKPLHPGASELKEESRKEGGPRGAKSRKWISGQTDQNKHIL